MAPQANPTSRSLRRAAARPAAPRGRQPSQRLLDAAEAGLLTRGNTKKGTRGRQAVDRVVFLRRRAAAPDLSAREAVGHKVPGSRPTIATFIESTPDGPRQVTIEGVNRADLRRAGKYEAAVRQLLDGEISPEQFERRFRRWRPIAGHQLESRPREALAAADAAASEGHGILFDSGRARRRRVRAG